MPFVILKMGHERFELATSLMRTKPPSKARQNELIREWRGGCDVYIGPRFGNYKSVFRLSPQVWKNMLDLIYSGNSKTAFRMLKKFWTPNTYPENLMDEAGGRDAAKMSRRQFEQALLTQLRHSAYLSELKQLNHEDSRICNLVQRAPRSREEL